MAKVEKGINDLATIYPNVAEEWDYGANAGRLDGHGNDISTPDKVSPCSNQKVHWTCRSCNHKWAAVISKRTARGQDCPKCASKKISNARKKSHTVFVEEMASIMPTVDIIGTYDGWDKSIQCRCKVCNNEWKAIPNNLRKKEGCPKCGREKLAVLNRKPHEQFVSELFAINPKVDIIGEYKGSSTKIKCKCLECEREWTALPSNLLKGSGCPACARNQTSFLENFILLTLRNALGAKNVLSRNRTAVGKELDIYIPSLKTGIEPGSWYWHKQRFAKDKEKYELCCEKGIRLIILYDSFDGEYDISSFGGDVLTCSKNLGNKNEQSLLKEYTIKIFDLLGLEYLISEEDEQEILVTAKRASMRKTTSQVRDELYLVQPNVELLGFYTGSHSKISCRCKICGNEWQTDRDHLILRKQGCPVCNSNKKPVINLNTGEVYESVSEAARQVGVTWGAIKSVCAGTNKSCKGFRFAFTENL